MARSGSTAFVVDEAGTVDEVRGAGWVDLVVSQRVDGLDPPAGMDAGVCGLAVQNGDLHRRRFEVRPAVPVRRVLEADGGSGAADGM